jgi:hypothetical protein
MNYKQGKWYPKNPQKYSSDVKEIIFRSSWEKRVFEWLDSNPSVIEWNSESVIIPYVCATDGRVHRYFVDIFAVIRNSKGEISKFLVEIKPHIQRLPPKVPKKQTPRYITEVAAYIKNQSKWRFAKEYAEKRGMKFLILDEYDLGISKRKS